MFGKDEGFTLVELMVVVLIIGILVAIAVPIFNAAKASAQTKTCFANQRTIEGAVQSYNASNGTMPAAMAAGTNGSTSPLLGTYIKAWPYCPLASAGTTTTYAYGYDAAGGVVLSGSDTHGHY